MSLHRIRQTLRESTEYQQWREQLPERYNTQISRRSILTRAVSQPLRPFMKIFRMAPQNVDQVVAMVASSFSARQLSQLYRHSPLPLHERVWPGSKGFPAIHTLLSPILSLPIEMQVLVTLNFLGTGENPDSVAGMFDNAMTLLCCHDKLCLISHGPLKFNARWILLHCNLTSSHTAALPAGCNGYCDN